MNISYASAHWHDERGRGLAPNTFPVVSVAEMEEKLRNVANEYAAQGNYDYARRVYRTGMVLSDVALMATTVGEQGSEEREYAVRRAGASGASQALNNSRDGEDVPMDRRIEYTESGGQYAMPKELYDLYQEVWAVFAEENQIDIQLGYDSWRNGEGLR